MKVESHERQTGMGATRYSAILVGEKWVRVSNMSNARSHGRQSGVYVYSVEVPDNTVNADFYRSNSGKERVSIYQNGKSLESFSSFEDAHFWAKGNKEVNYSEKMKFVIEELEEMKSSLGINELNQIDKLIKELEEIHKFIGN